VSSEKSKRDRLWKEIEKSSHGDLHDKLNAVDKAIQNFKSFPMSYPIIKALADKTQPNEVRVRIAANVHKAPLTTKQHFELMKCLSQDASRVIRISKVFNNVTTH